MSEYEHQIYQKIMRELLDRANEMLKVASLTPKAELTVREKLNENMRFWK
jgi:hypothetical protein